MRLRIKLLLLLYYLQYSVYPWSFPFEFLALFDYYFDQISQVSQFLGHLTGLTMRHKNLTVNRFTGRWKYTFFEYFHFCLAKVVFFSASTFLQSRSVTFTIHNVRHWSHMTSHIAKRRPIRQFSPVKARSSIVFQPIRVLYQVYIFWRSFGALYERKYTWSKGHYLQCLYLQR